ncbi:hypothetical protein GW17_00062043 [Ensete ventricosum]|nr:hypothetical protein GW17_00062043 [Ensete ventricosum]
MATWEHQLETHHRTITITDVGPQEQDAPTIGARGSLIRSCRSRPRDMELSLEDNIDLKMAGLLGPYLRDLRRSRGRLTFADGYAWVSERDIVVSERDKHTQKHLSYKHRGSSWALWSIASTRNRLGEMDIEM